MLNGGNFKRNNTVHTSEVCFISVFEVAALTIISYKHVTLRASMWGQQQCRHVRSRPLTYIECDSDFISKLWCKCEWISAL